MVSDSRPQWILMVIKYDEDVRHMQTSRVSKIPSPLPWQSDLEGKGNDDSQEEFH